MAVFLPFVLEGEQLEGELIEERRGFARARVKRVHEASALRVTPGCPYFTHCGGCQYQHTGYEHQLEIKQQILREAFIRIAKTELPVAARVHASPPWNYRNRTRMRVRSGGDFVLGYNRHRSSQILAVRECPISSPLINRAIKTLWNLGEAGRFPAEVREVEFFADAEDQRLLLECNVDAKDARNAKDVRTKTPAILRRLAEFAGELRNLLPQVVGLQLFTPQADGNLVQVSLSAAGQELRDSFGAGDLTYHCAAAEYQVSAGSFFQTNRYLTEALVKIVTSEAKGDYALDLYAGTGLFSLQLARSFREVTAVEASPFAFHDLRKNVSPNIRGYKSTTGRFLAELPHGTRFDYIVVDPPRAGLGEKATEILGRIGAPLLVYVSCDPSTLARDVKQLLAAGYRIEEAHLVDMFPQTFHIESVLRLVL